MPKTINQNVLFLNATPIELFKLYMDEKLHSEIISSSVNISDKEGEEFSAYAESITGKNLQIIKNKLIVQSWIIDGWGKDDIDSTLILYFEQKGKDTELIVTHANVPNKLFESIDKGWYDYYWTPWEEYLANKKIIKKK